MAKVEVDGAEWNIPCFGTGHYRRGSSIPAVDGLLSYSILLPDGWILVLNGELLGLSVSSMRGYPRLDKKGNLL